LAAAVVSGLDQLAAAMLVEAEGALLDAGRRLSALMAEVVFGFPVLIPQSQLEGLKDGGPITLEPVPIAYVQPVLLAVQRAKQLRAGRPQLGPQPPSPMNRIRA